MSVSSPARAFLCCLVASTFACSGEKKEEKPVLPYPAPDGFVPNAGPGVPSITFDTEDLFKNCAYLDGGPLDTEHHHNLLVMYDGYLLMPWAPEYGKGGLTFFDITDPCAPTVVGIGTSDEMRETHAIGFAELGERRFAVVSQMTDSERGGIQFWDITDVTQPRAISRIELPGFQYPGAYPRVMFSNFWQVPYVYVGGADNGIYIVDASDPENPQLVSQYRFNPLMRVGQVQVQGNLLVATQVQGARTAILDVSDPANPEPIPGGDFLSRDERGFAQPAYFTTFANGRVYYARLGGGGLMTYDVRQPDRPKLVTDVFQFGSGAYVFVHEQYAFLGQSGFAIIFDISDESEPVEVGQLDLVGDLDTIVPIGNLAVLSVDADAEIDRATAIAPWREEPDTNPPKVTFVNPADGSRGVLGSGRVGIAFNELVDPRTAWHGSVRLYKSDGVDASAIVEGFVSAQETIVNFWPKTPLEPETKYTIEIPAGGVRDFSGNAITEAFTAEFTTAGVGVLIADPGQKNIYALVGETIAVDGSGSTNAMTYQWDFGTGQLRTELSSDPKATISYSEPGRYQVVLSVFDATGKRASKGLTISVTEAPSYEPAGSASLIRLRGSDSFAAVEHDANLVTFFARTDDTFSATGRVSTCTGPRTIAEYEDGWFAVACPNSDQLDLLKADGTRTTIDFRYGAAPYGVVARGTQLYVTQRGLGEVAVVSFDTTPADARIMRSVKAVEDARGIALLPDGKLAVSRWRSPRRRGEVAVVDPSGGEPEIWPLKIDPQESSDTDIGGIPSYLEQLLVSPDGRTMAAPSLQANLREGRFLSGVDLLQDTVVRGVVSFFTLEAGIEVFDRRVQFDNVGLASSGVFTRRGDYLFIATRGSQTVERIDMLTGVSSGTIQDVGFAPEALAISADDRYLLVHSTLDRAVNIFDLDDFDDILPIDQAIATIETEPLTSTMLTGKQLFNDSQDRRLTREG